MPCPADRNRLLLVDIDSGTQVDELICVPALPRVAAAAVVAHHYTRTSWDA